MKEEWKDIVGYEGLYMISSSGRVLSKERRIRKWDGTRTLKGRIIKPAINLKGYAFVQLHKNGCSEMKTVHRLVADAFIPNPEHLPQINHKDENKENNCIENLEWCSASYNVAYGTRTKKVIAALGVPVIAYCLFKGTAERYDNYQKAADAIGVSRATVCRHARTGRPTQNGFIIRQA